MSNLTEDTSAAAAVATAAAGPRQHAVAGPLPKCRSSCGRRLRRGPLDNNSIICLRGYREEPLSSATEAAPAAIESGSSHTCHLPSRSRRIIWLSPSLIGGADIALCWSLRDHGQAHLSSNTSSISGCGIGGRGAMCAPPGPPTPSSPRPPTGTLAEADAAADSPKPNECTAEATDEGVSANSTATEQPAAASATAEAATGDVEGAEGEVTPPDEAAGRQRRNRWADESDDLDSPAFDPMTTAATPLPLSLDSRGDFLPPPYPIEDRGLRDLLVSDLDGRTTERDIMQLFQGVKKVRIRKGDGGRRPNSVSAIVSFVSHEAVCAALAMNGRPYPKRGGGNLGGAHRGDRHKGGTGNLRVQVPPKDSLDVCFSKFRTGGLGGGPSAAAADGHKVGGGLDGGTALSSGSVAAAASSSSSPSRGGSWGSGRASGAELRWRKHLKSPEGTASTAAGATGGAAASTKEQHHQRQNHEATGINTSGGSSSPAVALVAPKDLLKEQLKPQGLKLNPAIFGEAKPRDEAALPQKQRETREGPSRQGSPSNMSVLQQGMLAPPPPPSPQQQRQQPPQPHLQKQQPPQPPEQQQRWRSGLLTHQQQQHQQQSSSDRPRRRQDPLCGGRPRDDAPLMSAPKQQQLLQQKASPVSRSHHIPVHPNQGSVSVAGVATAAADPGAAPAAHAESRDSLSTLTEKSANAPRPRRADGWGNWSRATGAQEDTANPPRGGWRVGPASSSNSSSSTIRTGEALADAATKENSSAGENRRRGPPKLADISATSASPANRGSELQQQQQQQQQHQQNQSRGAFGNALLSHDALAARVLPEPTANHQQNDEQQQREQQQTAQRKLKRGLAWQSKGEALQEPPAFEPQEPCVSREGPFLAYEPTGAPHSPSHVLRQQPQQHGFGQGVSGAREDRRSHRGDKRLGGGQGGGGVQGRSSGDSVVRWGLGRTPMEGSATSNQRPAASDDQRPGQRVPAERFGAGSSSSSNSFPRMQSELGTHTDSQRPPTPVSGRAVSARERGGRWQRGPGASRGKRDDNTESASNQKHWRHQGSEGSPSSNTLKVALEEEGAPPCLSTSSRETTAASALAAGEGKARLASQQQLQHRQQQQQHQDRGKMRLENKGSSSQQDL
ncbi:hypothetical protein Esti_003075 [Eimeria stiedai]